MADTDYRPIIGALLVHRRRTDGRTDGRTVTWFYIVSDALHCIGQTKIISLVNHIARVVAN